MMRTYWLVGKYLADDEICLAAGQYQKLLEPDTLSEDEYVGEPEAHEDASLSGNELRVREKTEGKISVADSGISMDKGVEDKIDNNTLLNNDSTCETNVKANYGTKLNISETKDDETSSINKVNKACSTEKEHSKIDSEKFALTQFFCETFDRKKTDETDALSKTPCREDRDHDGDLETEEHQSTQSNPKYSRKKKKYSKYSSKKRSKSKGNKYDTGDAEEPHFHDNTIQLANVEDEDDNEACCALEEDERKQNDTNQSTNLTSCFKPPARNSATDFMTVHNNWFEEGSF